MLRELRKVPIPDDDSAGKVFVAIALICWLGGWLSHAVSWAFLAFVVYAAIAAIAECAKFRNPEKYSQGLLGFGPQPWLDDATGAVAGVIVFGVAAFYDLHVIAALVASFASFVFFTARGTQRQAEREKERRERW
ncbi:MAG TPA: hypothetical protein P5080_03460 [Candidatus Paceibacterota bacterium]|nr:hypothetical protein [Candidatus Pacearchaeota archaeon]HRZ51098.1 hypothetical protein [Candidatus Paceibacterota bacterium]HSA36743.1 hypothetical protein [Candidatus Paceibacterota bacterium]